MRHNRFDHEISSTSSYRENASTSNISPWKPERIQMRWAAEAIITALSVQNRTGGRKSLIRLDRASSLSFWRSPLFAATPPTAAIRERPHCSAALKLFETSTSTMASWKLAAKSSSAYVPEAAPAAGRPF